MRGERGARIAVLILAGLGILSLAIYLPFLVLPRPSPDDVSPRARDLPSDKRPSEPQFSDPLRKHEPDVLSPEAPQEMLRVDRIYKGLEKSTLAYDVPTYMQLRETETISLTLSPSASIEELKKHLREKGAKGRIGSAQQVRTSERMKARLTGQDFEIEAISPETQAISYE